MKKSILVLIILAAFTACKRDLDLDKFGPEVIIVPQDFTVSGFTVGPSASVNLASQDMFLNCAMSQRAEFKIVIKGLTSGAEKIISGTGEIINASNSLWTGDSDNLSIFRSGEDCLVELSFRGATKKYYDTITITGENLYPQTKLINNFEGITFDKNGPNTGAYGNYFDGVDISQSDIKTDAVLKTPQGAQSVSFDGMDVNNSYYIGGMYFFPPSVSYDFAGESDLYLNAYIYSYGDNSSNLYFGFTETDNDEWTKEVAVTWEQGWNLVSLRLKDFSDNNPATGNGILNPDSIKGFNVNMNARTAGARARVNIDYLIVSYGKVFNP